MLNDDEIVAAARAIGPHLPALIPEHASAVADELAQHFAVPEGSKISANALVAILRRREPTRVWLAEYLKEQRTIAATRGYVAPLNKGEPVRARKFVCPHGDYTWYRAAAGADIPLCPAHAVALRAAD